MGKLALFEFSFATISDQKKKPKQTNKNKQKPNKTTTNKQKTNKQTNTKKKKNKTNELIVLMK
jgi:hypothetical protein